MIAHVSRPSADQFAEPRCIIAKQRTRSFFKAGQIAANGQHEVIGALVGLSGRMRIRVEGHQHFYDFDFSLPGA